MAKKIGKETVTGVVKRTSQGGSRPKTSTMSKTQKRTFKRYRGQGK
jgi:hypothetical protein